MLFLREDTEAVIRCGPFVSPTDGYTAVTNVSAPTVNLSKAHAAFAARNGTTWTHDAGGWYACQLSTTDTSTPGALVLQVAGAATYLPVFIEFMVVPPNVFDSLFAAAGTDYLQVDVTQFGGTNATATGGRAEVNTSHIAGTAVSTTSAQIGVNVVNAGGTAWASGAITAAVIATGAIDADAIADNAIDAGAIATGAITNTKFAAGAIDAAAIATDAIDGDAMAATANTEIATAVWANGTRALTDKSGFDLADATSDAVIADAVWNAATATYGGVGSYGEKVEGLNTGSVTVSSIGANVITAAAIQDDAITAAKLATDAISADAVATDAVNEIADGVLDRSITEPSAIFTWPASLRNIIKWVGALSRNKITQTSSTQALRNDADSGNIASSTVSDAAGTTTRGEWT